MRKIQLPEVLGRKPKASLMSAPGLLTLIYLGKGEQLNKGYLTFHLACG